MTGHETEQEKTSQRYYLKKTIGNTWKEVRVKILLQHTDQMMFANNIAKSYPSGLFSIETVREGPHPCGLWKS